METKDNNRVTKICEHLFVGSYKAALSSDLKSAGITKVLKLFKDEFGYKRQPGIGYRVRDIKDGDDSGFLRHLPRCIKFIREGSGATLVHCHMGISRSPGIAIAHLIVDHRMSYDDAVRHVRKVHPQTDIKFEKVLRALAAKWCTKNAT